MTFLIVLAVVIVNVTLGLKKTLKAAFATVDETQSEILMPTEAPTEPPLIYAQ
ncbi:MAG: hypothetical protein ACLT33_08005 [Lachnospira pectinoschiza]